MAESHAVLLTFKRTFPLNVMLYSLNRIGEQFN